MDDNFEECLGLQVRLTKNTMDLEHNKYLKPHEVSAEQGLLLKCVYEMPGSTQTQIAEFLNKDKTTITRMIDTLVKKGKLERRNCEHDRRVFEIYLTQETAAKVAQISPLFEAHAQALKNSIDPLEYKIAIKVLKQIRSYYKGLNA